MSAETKNILHKANVVRKAIKKRVNGFIRNNFSLLLVALGVAGFVFADIILFPLDNALSKKHISPFKEVAFYRKNIAISLLNANMGMVIDSIIYYKKAKNVWVDSAKLASYQKEATLIHKKKDSVAFLNEEAFNTFFNQNFYIQNGFTLDSIAFMLSTSIYDSLSKYDPVRKSAFIPRRADKYLEPGADTILSNHINVKKDYVIQLPVFYKDASGLLADTCLKFNFALLPPKSNIAFINKYPGFGVWLMMLFIMVSFWFMLFFAMPASVYQLNTQVNTLTNVSVNMYRVWVSFFSTLGFMLLIIYISATSFYDASIYNDIFFMYGFIKKTLIYFDITGYVAAALCLAGFLNCAYLMYQLYIKGNLKDNSEGLKKFMAVKKYLNLNMLIASILLSLLVICTGTLFTSYNSIDFIKFFNKDNTGSYLKFDMLFLYALMHSFVLFLFYIPVKITAIQVENMYQQPADDSSNAGKPVFVKDILLKFQDILVPTAPVIAGTLQILLNSIFGK